VIEALKSFSIGYFMMIDSIRVFTGRTGKLHYIGLSSNDIPEKFQKSVDTLRKRLTEIGCSLEPDFMFHITIGFVDASRITLAELKQTVAEIEAPGYYLCLSNYRLVRYDGHKVEWDSTCLPETECVFSNDNIRLLCDNNRRRIMNHENISYILHKRKVRFINPMGEFDYTTFGNFVFDYTGTILLITKDAKYTRYHHWGILDYSLWSVVPVIFAGVSTGYKDDTGREIFTGDIVTMDDHFTSMVEYWNGCKEPVLVGDNCEVPLSETQKSLHIEGTAYCNMSAKMFEEYDEKHINWYYSQFQPFGLSRDEVIRMAKLAYYKPHFINELNIIGRSPAIYSDIYEVMKGNFRIAYLISYSEYEDADGNSCRDIYADNLPIEKEFDSYEIKMIDADTPGKQLSAPFKEFIDYAHSHPETVFILCDFKECLSQFVNPRNIRNAIKSLLPIVTYNLRNIVLPAWLYFELDSMQQNC